MYTRIPYLLLLQNLNCHHVPTFTLLGLVQAVQPVHPWNKHYHLPKHVIMYCSPTIFSPMHHEKPKQPVHCPTAWQYLLATRSMLLTSNVVKPYSFPICYNPSVSQLQQMQPCRKLIGAMWDSECWRVCKSTTASLVNLHQSFRVQWEHM